MGFANKSQLVDGGGLQSQGKKWVIAGISVQTSLKPINTKPPREAEEEEAYSTTPTAKEARIPDNFSSPPAPIKSRPPWTCNFKTPCGEGKLKYRS